MQVITLQTLVGAKDKLQGFIGALAFTFILVSGIEKVQADDAIVDNLEVLQGANLRQYAVFWDSLSVIKSVDSATTGFSIQNVFNSQTPRFVGEIIPAHWETRTEWVDVYGWTDTTQWVEDWGWVTRDVEVPNYGNIDVNVEIPEMVDGDGNVIPAHTETHPEWGITGYTTSTQMFYEVTGGHSEVTGSTYGVVGTNQETVNDHWVDEVRNGEWVTDHSSPEIRQTSLQPDTLWTWRNGERQLMHLSTDGISIPYQGGTQGVYKTLLNDTSLDQSYGPLADGTGHGTMLNRDMLEVWEGTSIAGQNDQRKRKATEVNPGELRIKAERIHTGSNTSVSVVETRISAESSSFSGLVIMNGTLLVPPRGGLEMGPYTAGPKPASVPDAPSQ